MVKHLMEGYHAWEMGSGVMPLVRKLIEAPVDYLRGRRSVRLRAGLAGQVRSRRP